MELDYFWDSSYANIVLKLQAYNEQMRLESMYRANDAYVLAHMIAVNVGAMFSKNAKVPPIHKFYPHLFEDETKVPINEQKREKGKLSKSEVGFLNMVMEMQRQRDIMKQNNKE